MIYKLDYNSYINLDINTLEDGNYEVYLNSIKICTFNIMNHKYVDSYTRTSDTNSNDYKYEAVYDEMGNKEIEEYYNNRFSQLPYKINQFESGIIKSSVEYYLEDYSNYNENIPPYKIKAKFTYDDQGREIHSEKYDKNQNLLEYCNLSYIDDSPVIQGKRLIDPGTERDLIYSGEYNSEGKPIGIFNYINKYTRKVLKLQEFNNGELIRATHYHDNGLIKLIAYYRNDVKHGSFESYDEYGNQVEDSNYLNGEYDGEVKLYDNGIMTFVGSYSEGVPQGVHYYYRGGGQLYRKITYDNSGDILEELEWDC